MTAQPAYCGIDVAFAKGKRLPVAVCTPGVTGLMPLPLREHRDLLPPRGSGNWATLDDACVSRFAEDTAAYLRRVERRFGVRIDRVAMDAPRTYAPEGGRRAAERAMDRQRISCFSTPDRTKFTSIRAAVAAHIAANGRQDRTPFANQLWMLVGFALFDRLGQEFDCIEVFPNAIVQALERGVAHKSSAAGVQRQLELIAASTGCVTAGDVSVAFGPLHDRLDAFMAAWVASLPRKALEAHGDGLEDTIWTPKPMHTDDATL